MALFASQQELFERPMDPAAAKPGERPIPKWLTYVAAILTWWIPYIFMRLRVHNKENLRQFKGKSGVMIAGNHTSYLDPYFVILTSLFSQWPRFMAKDDLFEKGHGFSGAVLARLGAFPIKRDSADRVAIKRASRMLSVGEIVCIFPEGTRRDKTDYNIELHAGAAFIARMANVPILPVGISGADRLWGKGLLHMPKITLRYGKPVYESDFDWVPRQERLDVMTWFFMREVHALSKDILPANVDMDALYPGSTNYAELLRDFVPRSRLEAAGA